MVRNPADGGIRRPPEDYGTTIGGRGLEGNSHVVSDEFGALPNDDPSVIAHLDALAAAAAGGDSHALDALLFQVDVRRLAEPAIRKVLINSQDVEDAVQDVLLAVAQTIGNFEGRSRFTTWLFTLARNKAVGVLRRKRGDAVDFADDDMIADVARLSSIVSTHETIHAVLAGLPDHYRSAVTLRDLDGLSYAECADVLDLNLNTVRSHIARGRALLAEALSA